MLCPLCEDLLEVVQLLSPEQLNVWNVPANRKLLRGLGRKAGLPPRHVEFLAHRAPDLDAKEPQEDAPYSGCFWYESVMGEQVPVRLERFVDDGMVVGTTWPR